MEKLLKIYSKIDPVNYFIPFLIYRTIIGINMVLILFFVLIIMFIGHTCLLLLGIISSIINILEICIFHKFDFSEFDKDMIAPALETFKDNFKFSKEIFNDCFHVVFSRYKSSIDNEEIDDVKQWCGSNSFWVKYYSSESSGNTVYFKRKSETFIFKMTFNSKVEYNAFGR